MAVTHGLIPDMEKHNDLCLFLAEFLGKTVIKAKEVKKELQIQAGRCIWVTK